MAHVQGLSDNVLRRVHVGTLAEVGMHRDCHRGIHSMLLYEQACRKAELGGTGLEDFARRL